MSQDNVEVVRAMYAAFARRDRATMLRHLDPAMTVHDRAHHPEASVYDGPDGFLRFAETDWEAFDEVTYEPRAFDARGPFVIVQITKIQTTYGNINATTVPTPASFSYF